MKKIKNQLLKLMSLNLLFTINYPLSTSAQEIESIRISQLDIDNIDSQISQLQSQMMNLESVTIPELEESISNYQEEFSAKYVDLNEDEFNDELEKDTFYQDLQDELSKLYEERQSLIEELDLLNQNRNNLIKNESDSYETHSIDKTYNDSHESNTKLDIQPQKEGEPTQSPKQISVLIESIEEEFKAIGYKCQSKEIYELFNHPNKDKMENLNQIVTDSVLNEHVIKAYKNYCSTKEKLSYTEAYVQSQELEIRNYHDNRDKLINLSELFVDELNKGNFLDEYSIGEVHKWQSNQKIYLVKFNKEQNLWEIDNDQQLFFINKYKERNIQFPSCEIKLEKSLTSNYNQTTNKSIPHNSSHSTSPKNNKKSNNQTKKNKLPSTGEKLVFTLIPCLLLVVSFIILRYNRTLKKIQ